MPTTVTLTPDDFRCWCTAMPGQPCLLGTSEAGDLELVIAKWHQARMYAAKDGNDAIKRRGEN